MESWGKVRNLCAVGLLKNARDEAVVQASTVAAMNRRLWMLFLRWRMKEMVCRDYEFVFFCCCQKRNKQTGGDD
jgi:hypothetical protein